MILQIFQPFTMDIIEKKKTKHNLYTQDSSSKSNTKKGSRVKKFLSRKKKSGAVLLSHSQIYSTIAAGALNLRVREGNECFCSAMDAGK